MTLAGWRGTTARRSPAARDLLSPLQIRCLGALLLAAQLPHAPHLPIWVAVAGIMLVGLRIALLRRDRQRPQMPPARIPSWALVLFAVAAAFAVRASFGYFLGRAPSVAFLYILVAIKYLETRSKRDGTLLVCLACFLLVTPFFSSQSLLAAFAALPAVVLVGVALDALTGNMTAGTRPFSWWAAVRRSGVMLLQGVPVAAFLFFFFPRLAAPLWGLPADYGAQSGLSDSMSPGQISELSLSDSVAFRVDFDGPVPPPSQRYWRGPVFSFFDGRTWKAGLSGLGSEAPLSAEPGITYTVTLEPNYRPWLFALELPAALPTLAAGSASVGTGAPILTHDQQLLLRMPVTQSLRYTQRSALRSEFPGVTARDAGPNLGIGRGNTRTLQFARELRARHPDDVDYINAVLTKFNREDFVYTLAPPFLDRNPVDLFLFEERRGFCEHYASAFVLLLRAAGIPARVVTGYQGGTVNPRGGYMIVRQSDAHAWAEALVDGRWRRYDPTAAVAPSRIEMGLGGALPAGEPVPFLARLDATWLTGVQLVWDAFNHNWRRNIIGFNRDRQQSLWRDWKLDQLAPWQIVALVGLALLAWGGGVVAWLMWKRRHQERALVLWDDLNRRLAHAGLPRLPYEGPLAFAARAGQRWPQFAIAFAAIGESFAELRYGSVAVERERDALVATLERAIEVLPAPATLRTATD
jgi:transglutaminase-like putative cysteine protease